MKIAVKDSNKKRLKKIKKILINYYGQNDNETIIDTFETSEELVNNFNRGYGIVFLEMGMRSGEIPGVEATGMDTARELRKNTPYLPIIFMNWINESIVEFAFVSPQHYVLDMFQQDSFLPVMNRINEQLTNIPSRTICINSTDKTIRVISVTDIVFAEVNRKIITIHLYGGETVDTYSTMKQFKERLSVYPEFITPHQSFIINAVYIYHISPTQVVMKSVSEQIPVSRGKFNSLIENYQDYVQKYCILPYPTDDRKAKVDI